MTAVVDRFLRYVSVDTQSMEDEEVFPSTGKQKILGRMLEEELRSMGAAEVRMDDKGYVFAEIPSTAGHPVPALGFIAHMDTAPACSGTDRKSVV